MGGGGTGDNNLEVRERRCHARQYNQMDVCMGNFYPEEHLEWPGGLPKSW